MTKRNSLIAAAAVALAGTAGMAGWLSAEAGGKAAPASVAAPAPEAQPGVVETESAVQPSAPAEAPAAPEVMIVEQPFVAPPARPVERAPRTPIAAPAPAPAVNRASAPAPARPAEPIEPVEPTGPVEPARVPVEVRVPAGAVLGLRLATSLSSDTAEVEDRVEATVTRDVIAGGRVAIPAGTRVLGSVNEVTRGGKFRERARLGIRFHTLVLADGARETMRVDAIVREGESPARESAAKIGGGAVGGAIIGGIMGGKKGAILGGAAGASAGTAVVVAGDRSVATLAAGSPLSVRLDAPVTVLIERN